MKISYNWLKNYLAFDLPVEKTGELLTDCGLEIEGIESVDSVPGGLKGLVVGEVMSCDPHPDADRLKKTTVNIGGEELLPIVCGAPNVAKGQKIIVATVGTELFPEDGDSFKIKKSKIRGEVSQGMICAEDEIGLGKGHDGIMVLDDSAKVGTPAAEYFNIEAESTFEIGLTPNRADSMSHYGVARDLVAVFNRFGIEHGKLTLPSVDDFKADENTNKISIDVKDSDACPRYVGITIDGIKVEDSPEWLQKSLRSIGLNPINNVVDVTNYVLHELGQPLHAFDADKITGNKVVVQQLNNKTKFTTLDEVERELSDKDLMICNADEGMCIAGVFGGLTSGVTNSTTRIFLESAYFNPVSVRKTAKRHGLNTDASFRFERGIDPDMTVYAAKRAALLIKEIAGGKITSDVMEHYPTKLEGFDVSMSYKNCDRLIGVSLDCDIIKSIIKDLEIDIVSETAEGLELKVPAFKVDVQREADVVEEILRVYGYNEIELPQKMSISLVPTSKPDPETIKNIALNFLADNGFNEMMANSLTKGDYYGENLNTAVEILNPLSQDLGVMRQRMVYSGLEAVLYNQNRSLTNIRLFEFGKIYNQYQDGNKEEQHISIYLSGDKSTLSWNSPAEKTTVFQLKGLVEGLLKKLGLNIDAIVSKESKSEELQYGIQLSLQKLKIADIGEVSGKYKSDFGIKNPVFYADLNWDNLFELVKRSKTKFKEISKFPSVKRDLALLVDSSVKFDDLKKIARQAERQYLKQVGIFDIYEGKGLEPGKKSYAMNFEFQDETKTLTDKVVEKAIRKIYDQLVKQAGAKLRSGEL
ncbi:MAG: phenylalanine--tRNA ligase subunit beta [Salibacteraceae bacterium]